MPPLPAKAPDDVRQSIIEALQDPDRRFLDNKGSSRSWLIHWDLTAKGLYQELIDGLEISDLLFLKPPEPNKPQVYQCILDWPEDGDEYPAIIVHVTLAPRGDPPSVRVAVHNSDTLKTLPALPTKPTTDEDAQTN
jgi:hypothetical protein